MFARKPGNMMKKQRRGKEPLLPTPRRTPPRMPPASSSSSSMVDAFNDEEEERRIIGGGEIIFLRDSTPSLLSSSYCGWDHRRWSAYDGIRKLQSFDIVFKVIEEIDTMNTSKNELKKKLFFRSEKNNKHYLERALAIYEEPKLILLLRRPTNSKEVLEILGVQDTATEDDDSGSNDDGKRYWIAERVLDPSICKLDSSPLDSESWDQKEKSCFSITTPTASLTLSCEAQDFDAIDTKDSTRAGDPISVGKMKLYERLVDAFSTASQDPSSTAEEDGRDMESALAFLDDDGEDDEEALEEVGEDNTRPSLRTNRSGTVRSFRKFASRMVRHESRSKSAKWIENKDKDHPRNIPDPGMPKQAEGLEPASSTISASEACYPAQKSGLLMTTLPQRFGRVRAAAATTMTATVGANTANTNANTFPMTKISKCLLGDKGTKTTSTTTMMMSHESLKERGHKLDMLQEKSAQLVDDSADFARMAKQLSNRQKKMMSA